MMLFAHFIQFHIIHILLLITLGTVSRANTKHGFSKRLKILFCSYLPPKDFLWISRTYIISRGAFLMVATQATF